MLLKTTTPLLLLLSASNAFTVAPPPQQAVLSVVTSPLVGVSSTVTNLPSQRELASLASSSSSTLLSAATAAAATKTPGAAPAKTAAAPSSAPAAKLPASGLSISDVKYDGVVPKTEADEYVVITNGSKSPIDASGDYLYVATSGTQGATFNFPQNSIIKPGASVRIYTNEIHKETGGYSFGYGKAIWNNQGGLAVLKDSSDKKLGEFKY